MWDEQQPVALLLEDMKLPSGEKLDGLVIRYASSVKMANGNQAPAVVASFGEAGSNNTKNELREKVQELTHNPNVLVDSALQTLEDEYGLAVGSYAPRANMAREKMPVIAVRGEWFDEETYDLKRLTPGDTFQSAGDDRPGGQASPEQGRLLGPG